MRVLLVGDGKYPRTVSGVTRVVYELGEALKEHDNDVRTLSIRPRRDGRVIPPCFKHDCETIAGEIDEFSPDIVHVHDFCVSPVVFLARHRQGDSYPIIVTAHLMSRSDHLIAKKLAPKFLRRADRVTCVSEYRRRTMIKLGLNYDIKVIGNGVDTRLFHPARSPHIRKRLGFDEDDLVLLYMGRIAPDKDTERMIDLQKELETTSSTSVRTLIAGWPQEDYLHYLSRRVEETGSGKIKFELKLVHSLQPAYYSAVDVFVNPSTSIFEAFGVVQLEAMSCAKPVVCSDWNGFPEVVADTETGFLCPVVEENGRTRMDLKAAVKSILLLSDPNRRKEMGTRARRAAEDHDWRRVSKTYLGLYEKAVDRTNPWSTM